MATQGGGGDLITGTRGQFFYFGAGAKQRGGGGGGLVKFGPIFSAFKLERGFFNSGPEIRGIKMEMETGGGIWR